MGGFGRASPAADLLLSLCLEERGFMVNESVANKKEIRMKGLGAFGVGGAALFFVQLGVAQMSAPDTPPRVSMPAISGPLAAKYQADADRILKAGETDDDGYVALTYLCDHIGKRLSGSPQLNTAVEWGAELMRKAGLQNVTVQPVMVPPWGGGGE